MAKKYYVSAKVWGRQRREIISKGFNTRQEAQRFIIDKENEMRHAIDKENEMRHAMPKNKWAKYMKVEVM